jgi:hypothetical protein
MAHFNNKKRSSFAPTGLIKYRYFALKQRAPVLMQNSLLNELKAILNYAPSRYPACSL